MICKEGGNRDEGRKIGSLQARMNASIVGNIPLVRAKPDGSNQERCQESCLGKTGKQVQKKVCKKKILVWCFGYIFFKYIYSYSFIQ